MNTHLDPYVSGPLRRAGVALLGVALALALAGAVFVQWRQYKLLDRTVHFQNDALGWSFFQLEAEHLRLRNELQVAAINLQTADLAGLQLRYDIFVSRIGLVDHERAAEIMQTQTAYLPTIERVRGFVRQADRYLGPPPTAPLTPEAARRLLDQVDGLSVALHDLSLGASHLLYERATQRIDGIRRQSQIGIAFTLFQCLLMLALAAVVLRQLRALQQRRERLETLAASLSTARLEAEAASRSKSAFLANMSHEIRTPFHGMLGMMSLLQETPLSQQQSGYLRTAKESANHLLAILNDILDISKLESGSLQVSPAPVDLARLVREVEALMRAQAQAKDLALHVTMDADVPRWVRTDGTRLKQILFNLLSNAVKFTPTGHVHLKIATANDGADAAATVVFAVIDTGIGMDEAMQARLFQRFSQGDESTSRRHGGTGLGLEISRSLARLMDGDIAVASEPGRGSSFTLSIPLPAVEPPGPDARAAVPAAASAGRQLRVLVAEDHPVNQVYLEAVLDKLGHAAVFTQNGEEAVRAAQAEDFDIVLMDLHMPVMDGFAAARAIRALPLPRGAMPIVALTADAFQDSQERARAAGMDEMLTKPAHLPQLRELLARYGGGEAPRAAPVARETAPGELVDHATVQMLHTSLSPEKYARLLASFFESSGAAMTRLREAIREGERKAIREQAHSLKGASVSLGLRVVAEQANGIQRASADATLADLASQFDSLERQFAITRDLCATLGWLPEPAGRPTP
mgnify:CR=1 FL=1